MIGCLRTRIHMQPITALYFEFDFEYSSFISSGPEILIMSINVVCPKYDVCLLRLLQILYCILLFIRKANVMSPDQTAPYGTV